MDRDPPNARFETLKRHFGEVISAARALVGTTFAQNLIVGLVVILIAHYVFGIG
jgi:hypothetical protein